MSGANTKRLALVTGASRGIGRAVALELVRQNWRVILVARAQKALEKLDDEIRALGGEATLIPLDLRDGSAIDQLAAPLFERFGKLDGLAACAGALGSLTPAHQATPAIGLGLELGDLEGEDAPAGGGAAHVRGRCLRCDVGR